jgi:outer membrane protein insertion porin family
MLNKKNEAFVLKMMKIKIFARNFARNMAVAVLFLSLAPVSVATLSVLGASQAAAAVVSTVTVRGNTRMSADTVRSFVTVEPGKSFNNGDIDDSVKALFATGLFADVSIYQSGSALIVEVDENATINQIFFEGNKRLKDGPLSGMVRSQARGIFSPDTISTDVDIIRQAYSQVGRADVVVSSEVVPLSNNRVNIVYRVDEGGKTKIRSLTFVGNTAIGTQRLKEVISTKQSNLLSWLKNDDIYDPAKLSSDEEKLRRYYFNNGYADFQILSSSAVLDEVANEYNITITVDEGNKYVFGNVSIESTLAGVESDSLYNKLETVSGKTYSAGKVESSIIALTEEVATRGFAFVEVVPRGDRNFETSTIDIVYLVDQGARVYVEKINILGNDMTRDYVIRREFDMSEGDAFNQVFIQRAKKRLEDLGLFDSVDITTRSGQSADRVVVNVRVAEKASGEFSIGGGYSSQSGALAQVSFTEKNFMGRGQLLRISGDFGSEEQTYRFSFTEPYFLGYRMSAGFDIAQTTSDSDENTNYGLDSTSAVIRLGIPLKENTGISLFYSYSDTSTSISDSLLDPINYKNPPAGAIPPRDNTQGNRKNELSAALAPPNSPTDWMRSGFGYSFNYSTIDSRLVPREGVGFEFTQTAFGAGGDATYLKTEAKAIAYATLSEEADFVGMARLRGGALATFGSDSGFRTLDNFFQGSNQIRGFDSNGFGPRDPITGDALGGQYYWNATAEINFPAPFLPESFGIRGAVFADAGSLWGVDDAGVKAIRASNPGLTSKQLGQINGNDIRASVGASIIWNSPFGPLRFDYAEPIMSQKQDEFRQFNFGISSNF